MPDQQPSSKEPREIVMSYNAAHMRVRLEIAVSACLKSEEPPHDLMERAQKKMIAEKNAGRVALYSLKPEALAQVWQILREEAPRLSPDFRVQFTLAEGCPALPGFAVHPPHRPGALCSITLPPKPSLVKKWRLKWLLTATRIQLRTQGINTGIPHRAALRALRNRAVHGEKIVRVLLPAEPTNLKDSEEAPKFYNFKLSSTKREVTITILKPPAFGASFAVDQILADLKECIDRLKLQDFKILETSIRSDLELVNTGFERLGIGLPATILGAQRFADADTKKRQPPVKIPKDYPGKGLLKIEISPDGMTAQIKDFNEATYRSIGDINLDENWLRYECAGSGLPPIEAQYFERAMDRFSRKKNPNNLILATGTDGSAPREPKLVPVDEDIETAKSGNEDIRASRIPNIVVSGSRIATIAHQVPGKPRLDVFDVEHETPEPDPFHVECGEGVERRGGDFFATMGGLRIISADGISISQTYNHKGDVTLRTGDIIFQGNVFIKGNIDAGTTVATSGNLHVSGNIAAADIRVQGNLKVDGGINTGGRTEIHVKGSMNLGFVENAILYCCQDIAVEKSLLNSQVFCDGSVKCTGGQSVIAGGRLHVNGNIITRNLGFPGSIDTHLVMGEDWRGRKRLDARDARTERFRALLEDERMKLRELGRRSEAQLTARHKKLKDDLGSRIIRIKRIIEQAKDAADKVAAVLDYNEDTAVQVLGTLYAQVTFYFKDRYYRPNTDRQSTVFTPYLSPDSKFLSIDEYEELLEAKRRKMAG